MAPPSAAETETPLSLPFSSSGKAGTAPLEPSLPVLPSAAQEVSFPKPPTFTDKYKEREYQKGRLALAFRIFAKLGYDEGVAGHITLRDPVDPTSFWVNPFGVAWPYLKASDLILVNAEGKVVDGGPVRMLNVAAYMIHHAVHTARPEVNCVAHSHSIYGRAYCTLGIPLQTTTQDSCAFHNDLALYKSFNGIVLSSDEGSEIASALGSKKAALLQNHGLLTCAKTIEACVFWYISLDKSCRVALLAAAAAGGLGIKAKEIGEEEAVYTAKTVGTEIAGWFSALPTFTVMERESGDDYLK
ncbi:class II aldolase/adducin N-terminal [Bisporella sp. PMI_857]|nr:class II aldolase/adducin N-terminal [Bisporella sp. PMI_857]